MEDQTKSFQLSPAPDKNHHKRVLFYGIGALLLLLIGGCVGYYAGINNSLSSIPTFQSNKQLSYSPSQSKTQEKPTSSNYSFQMPNEWTTYTNKRFGYSFQYPSDWRIDTGQADMTTSYYADGPMSTIIVWKDGINLSFYFDILGTDFLKTGLPNWEGVVVKQRSIIFNNQQYNEYYLNQQKACHITPIPKACLSNVNIILIANINSTSSPRLLDIKGDISYLSLDFKLVPLNSVSFPKH